MYVVPPVASQLAAVASETDLALHRSNSSPELITRRLRELVPMLGFVGATVDEVEPGRAAMSAPLADAAMNQNGTQQAAVFYLLADYTVGVAMFASLPGIYVRGVHDRCDALPVQMWLRRCAVEHLAPGTGRVTAVVELTPERIDELRQQLVTAGKAELTAAVTIRQGAQVVATAEATVVLFGDLPPTPGARLTGLQRQNLKTSALMIAGLRTEPLARAVADEQGLAVAARMSQTSPQLPTLVAARSAHVERLLGDDELAQVLVLGVGLDPKPIRHARAGLRWFVLDLPEMLQERARRFRAAGASVEHEIPIATDLRHPSWDYVGLAAGLRPDLPTLVVAEGLSMYLAPTELTGLLTRAAGLCAHPHSRLWLDHVTPRLLELDLPAVTTFLATMSRLGEPFVLGFDRADDHAAGHWRTVDSAAASEVVAIDDPVHREYRFSVLARNRGQDAGR